MFFEDRWYQVEASSAGILAIEKAEENPIIALPTGSGKSVVVCKLVDAYLSKNPHRDVLVLSHVSKILKQNYSKLVEYFDGFPISLYSAGLDSREAGKITVAGIQSIYKKAYLFQNVGLIIIDECHLVNNEETGRYRDFVKNIPNTSIIGLTATPYRTGQGYLHKSKDSLFTSICYDLTSEDAFNRLIDEGYLCPLIPKKTSVKMDTEGLKMLGGDFQEKDMAERFNQEPLTEAIIRETVYWGKKYKKWLIFAIDISHANSIVKALERHGISARAVHSEMKDGFDETIAAYESGEIRALVSVNMLTTGIDIPDIDYIIMMRPTQSPVIHVQCLGRGLRPHPNKKYCFVLDFAGNTARLGPINSVKVREAGERIKKDAEPMSKECSNCDTLNHLSAKVCIACGEPFPIKSKLTPQASPLDLIKQTGKKLEDWIPVQSVGYSIHQKKGSPSSLRVSYSCGFNSYSEWICIDHSGMAKSKANRWVERRWEGEGYHPTDLKTLKANVKYLKKPKRILVNLDGKFANIKEFEF